MPCWMYVGCTLDDVGCELQIMLDVVLDVCWMAVEGAADIQTDTLGATGVQAPAPTLWQRPGFKPRRRLESELSGSQLVEKHVIGYI